MTTEQPIPAEHLHLRFTVDRIEGAVAVLLPTVPGAAGAHAGALDVPLSALPTACRAEGAVLQVPRDARGAWQWQAATRDAAFERDLRADLAARIRRLGRMDAGGDVVL